MSRYRQVQNLLQDFNKYNTLQKGESLPFQSTSQHKLGRNNHQLGNHIPCLTEPNNTTLPAYQLDQSDSKVTLPAVDSRSNSVESIVKRKTDKLMLLPKENKTIKRFVKQQNNGPPEKKQEQGSQGEGENSK